MERCATKINLHFCRTQNAMQSVNYIRLADTSMINCGTSAGGLLLIPTLLTCVDFPESVNIFALK